MAIPLPGDMGTALLNGINTGSSMFSRIMAPILDREHQKQAEEHFKQQMALRKQALARSGANSDIQRKILEQQLLGLTHKNDPMFELNQYKALEDMIKNGSQSGGAKQMPMPTQEMGEGMGMFSPEGPGEMQQSAQSSQSEGGSGGGGGIDLELLKAHPMLRGFAKKHLGYDPLAQAPQTPEEKQQMALDLFGKKEALKMQNKGGSTPTNAVLTQNQQAVQGIDTVVPMLDELIESKNIPGIMNFSPGKKAAYNAKTSSMIDTLIAAQSLPKVQASIDLVEEQIRRKSGETVADYKKRLGDLREDLMKRRGRSKSLLQNRQVNTDELPAQEKTLNGVKYRKIDGEWHEVE